MDACPETNQVDGKIFRCKSPTFYDKRKYAKGKSKGESETNDAQLKYLMRLRMMG